MTGNNQSLLVAIRQKETAITRDLAAARDTAAGKVEEAQEEARRIITQAAEDGRRQGETARQEALKEIERQAEAIIARALKEAETIRKLDNAALEKPLNDVFTILTGSIP